MKQYTFEVEYLRNGYTNLGGTISETVSHTQQTVTAPSRREAFRLLAIGLGMEISDPFFDTVDGLALSLLREEEVADASIEAQAERQRKAKELEALGLKHNHSAGSWACPICEDL